MKAVYTRREAIVAGLFGVVVAGIVWGPVVLRPFGSPYAIDLHTLRLPDDQPVVHARISPASVGATKTRPTSRVDINHADVVALQRLPGIGPTLAQRIITHRKAYGPFAGPRGLLEVDGIGAKRFDKIESWIEAR